MLLIISRFCFCSTSTTTETIPAIATAPVISSTSDFSLYCASKIDASTSSFTYSFSRGSTDGVYIYCWQKSVRLSDGYTSESSVNRINISTLPLSYSCPAGYSLNGINCTRELTTTVDDTCSELAAAGGSVLGSGYFISGSSSSLCVQANSSYKCAATNTGSSLYFTTVSDTCSYGTAAGTYFYYTGAECSTEGALSNNYKDGVSAAAACSSPVTDTTSSATTTDTASSATGTGCATITDGDTTLTECSSETATGTTSSATSTTASTDTASTTSTTSSATGTGNTYNTTNNTTTTNNNSSTSTVTNNYAASDSESTDDSEGSITTASTVTADYKDAISANDWSSRNYTTVLSDHISELKSSEIYSTASTFFAVNFSGGGCEPWGGTFELMGYSFTLSLDVCSFIAPYGVWMAAVVIFVCSFFAYRIAME